jgi:hypothetical protein
MAAKQAVRLIYIFIWRKLPRQFIQAMPQIGDTIAGKTFDAGSIVEDFDRDPAAIIYAPQDFEDG